MAAQQTWDQPGGQPPPYQNTAHLTNLPPETSEDALLDNLMVRYPFGRLYALHTRKVFESGSRGPHRVEALAAFFTEEAARLLTNYIDCYGIVFQGYIIKASLTNFTSPNKALPDHPNASRAVIVSGPKFFVTEDGIVLILEKTLPANLVRFQTIQTKNKKGRRRLLLLFTTYEAAKRAIRVLDEFEEGVTAVYGRDPLETGVKVDNARYEPFKTQVRWGESDYPDSNDPPNVKTSANTIPPNIPSFDAIKTPGKVTFATDRMTGTNHPNDSKGKTEDIATNARAPCHAYRVRPQNTPATYKSPWFDSDTEEATTSRARYNPIAENSMSTRELTMDKASNVTEGMPTKISVSMAPTATTAARLVDAFQGLNMLKPSIAGPPYSDKDKATTTYVCRQYNTDSGIEVEYTKYPGDYEHMGLATEAATEGKTSIGASLVEVLTVVLLNPQPSEPAVPVEEEHPQRSRKSRRSAWFSIM